MPAIMEETQYGIMTSLPVEQDGNSPSEIGNPCTHLLMEPRLARRANQCPVRTYRGLRHGETLHGP